MSRSKSVELSPSTRGRVYGLHEAGLSYRKISELTGLPVSTCHYTVSRFETHHTHYNLLRSGRPPIVDDRTRRHVLRTLRKERFSPYHIVAEEMGGGMTESMVRSIALNAGYHRCITRTKAALSREAVQQRRQWAKNNTSTIWSDIIFTDETTLTIRERSSCNRVTRLPGEEFLRETIKPSFRSGRKSLMVWGAIIHGRQGPLVRLNFEENPQGRRTSGGLNGRRYVEQVLEGPLKQFYDEVRAERGEGVMVVEDGAPAHKSNAAKQAREQLGIRNLPHPPNSPDLNPIEPLWDILKRRIAKIPGAYKSLDNLWRAAQTVWNGLTREDIEAHTGRMVDRVKAVKVAKGWQTKF